MRWKLWLSDVSAEDSNDEHVDIRSKSTEAGISEETLLSFAVLLSCLQTISDCAHGSNDWTRMCCPYHPNQSISGWWYRMRIKIGILSRSRNRRNEEVVQSGHECHTEICLSWGLSVFIEWTCMLLRLKTSSTNLSFTYTHRRGEASVVSSFWPNGRFIETTDIFLGNSVL